MPQFTHFLRWRQHCVDVWLVVCAWEREIICKIVDVRKDERNSRALLRCFRIDSVALTDEFSNIIHISDKLAFWTTRRYLENLLQQCTRLSPCVRVRLRLYMCESCMQVYLLWIPKNRWLANVTYPKACSIQTVCDSQTYQRYKHVLWVSLKINWCAKSKRKSNLDIIYFNCNSNCCPTFEFFVCKIFHVL